MMMKTNMAFFCIALFLLAFNHGGGSSSFSSAATLTIQNRCRQTVWPGIQPSAGNPILAGGGFQLPPNRQFSVNLPAGWSGRVWGRTGCVFDGAGRGRCATGDCGALNCNGAGGEPPATLAEVTLGQGKQDFYDVSLVDGYNLPMSMTAVGGNHHSEGASTAMAAAGEQKASHRHGGGAGRRIAQCVRAGCARDLNRMCPANLAVRVGNRVVACKSACMAFNTPMYCCTGSYGGPQTCKPTNYSKVFKSACPQAYSYAYDDASSLFTCTNASYVVTFC